MVAKLMPITEGAVVAAGIGSAPIRAGQQALSLSSYARIARGSTGAQHGASAAAREATSPSASSNGAAANGTAAGGTAAGGTAADGTAAGGTAAGGVAPGAAVAAKAATAATSGAHAATAVATDNARRTGDEPASNARSAHRPPHAREPGHDQ